MTREAALIELNTSSALPRILALTTDVAERVARPLAAKVDQEAHWPGESLCALGGAGLLGLNVPRRAGGLGEGLVALAKVTEILGGACSSTSMCFGMHCVATAVIASKATSFQEATYLRAIAAGRHITSLALSEAGTGAHFYLPRATFRREDDSFVINGDKSFITSAGHANSYVVSTVAPGAELDPGTFTCLIVDGATPGLSFGPGWNGVGMRGTASGPAKLDGVSVPLGNLLGHEGDQLWYVFEVVAPYFLVAMAGTYVGLMQAALDATVEHLTRHRHDHTDERLLENAAVTEKIAEMWTVVERSRLVVHHAATLGDEGSPEASKAMFAAKIEVADAAVSVTNTAMTLLGGRGYRENGLIARLMRDAQAAHVMSPTTHLLKRWLGRSVLGLPPI